MAVTKEQIDRINELAHKQKSPVGLTPKEAEEQKELRAAYIQAYRESMRANLESIKIRQPDGSLISVKEEHDKKYGGK